MGKPISSRDALRALELGLRIDLWPQAQRVTVPFKRAVQGFKRLLPPEIGESKEANTTLDSSTVSRESMTAQEDEISAV